MISSKWFWLKCLLVVAVFVLFTFTSYVIGHDNGYQKTRERFKEGVQKGRRDAVGALRALDSDLLEVMSKSCSSKETLKLLAADVQSELKLLESNLLKLDELRERLRVVIDE